MVALTMVNPFQNFTMVGATMVNPFQKITMVAPTMVSQKVGKLPVAIPSSRNRFANTLYIHLLHHHIIINKY
jgi:hypothetical protein